MPYAVTFVDSGLFSEAARRRAEQLHGESLEAKLGGATGVAQCFSALLRVSATPFEEVPQKDLQACAKYALAYFEAGPEALEAMVEGFEAHFEVRLT